VEPSIRERVSETMRRHNYQPDVRARSLRSRRTGLIGLVVHRPVGGLTNDPFFSSLTAEIIDYLSGKPYHLCLDMVTTDSSQAAIYDEMLRTRRVDGLILVESLARDERLRLLQEDSFPFILIGNPLSGDAIPSVDNDNVLAAETATQHLLDAGYERVGFLAGPSGVTVSDDRIIGYQRAIRNRQNEHLIWHSTFGADAARERALSVLAGENAPDALVVLDDFMAMGVVLAARQLGRRIPDQLGLVSFNDTSVCDLLECGLTSVSLNISTIVRTACDRLVNLIEVRDSQSGGRIIVPCELKVRGSSRRSMGVRG
jgi:DNA-binding LacI/PurR family transcriptional regulator